MSVDVSRVITEFQAQFGAAPEVVVAAPGRVNIIGEHTDYNHGFVLPMAIERETVIAARRREDRTLNASAANLGRRATADLDRRARSPQEPWIDYVVGVADQLAGLGKPLNGADMLISGDVPIGCGLSSSASLEMAALTMFESLGGFVVPGAEGPRLGQRVENDFLGLKTGIMDQFISRMGQKNHALFLDCRTYVYQLVPVAFAGARFVIANTCVARGLTASKYNERVAECREAVRILGTRLGGTGTHLRDFSLEDLESCRGAMPEVVYRRARHVITDNARTHAACDAMRAGDVIRLGALMNEGDASCREDYEVTCPELDIMTETARHLPGCHGSRMTGAGFGGCTINLVETEATEAFVDALLNRYERETNIKGEAIVSSPAAGARRIA